MDDKKLKDNFIKNLNRLLDEKGKKQSEVADELNILRTTFSSWCVGQSMPRMDKISMLADYFKVNVSDLLEDKKNKTSNTHDTPLLDVYHRLNARGKEKVLDYASDLAKSPDYTTAPTHPYRIAARGGGVMDLTEEEYNKKLIEETENTKVVTSESHPWL